MADTPAEEQVVETPNAEPKRRGRPRKVRIGLPAAQGGETTTVPGIVATVTEATEAVNIGDKIVWHNPRAKVRDAETGAIIEAPYTEEQPEFLNGVVVGIDRRSNVARLRLVNWNVDASPKGRSEYHFERPGCPRDEANHRVGTWKLDRTQTQTQ